MAARDVFLGGLGKEIMALALRCPCLIHQLKCRAPRGDWCCWVQGGGDAGEMDESWGDVEGCWGDVKGCQRMLGGCEGILGDAWGI